MPHQKLIAKLGTLGMRGILSKFSFQLLPESCIKWPHIILGSGGEWGSPGAYSWLLFIFYVNDIPYLIETNIRMFADGTKTFSVIQSLDDHLKLQGDVDQLL